MTQQEFEELYGRRCGCGRGRHDNMTQQEFENLIRLDVSQRTETMRRDRLLHRLAQYLDVLLREEDWNIFQWVPVEEELPPFNDLVLITYRERWKDTVSKEKKERINIATAKWMAGQWSVEVGIEGRFVLDGIKERNADGLVTEILAWLPLPRPYEPQPVREGREE